MKICFTVPGDPVGKQRPRVTRYGTYTPEKTQAYEALVLLRYREAAYRAAPLTGALNVRIQANFGIPSSYTKARKEAILRGEERPTKKPDADNIAKIILDALNGLAWKDDAQVVGLMVQKRYVTGHWQEPSVYVEIEEVIPNE